VEQKRAQTLILAARQAAVLEATLEGPVDRALARLQSIPGIGPWTAQQVAERAFGFADAVPTGDFHLPNEIAWVLAREPRGTDARMLQLLAPYAGHRGRVIRYIVAARIRAPKRGPRLALHDIRAS
jgi:3-methyladenine DNA glycosylase/8-oxoguanine DNA glycosylase